MEEVSPSGMTGSVRLHDVVLARKLKMTGNVGEQDGDLRIFLKLRENRRRIHRLESILWSEEMEISDGAEDEDRYFDDLHAIETILNNMRKELIAL